MSGRVGDNPKTLHFYSYALCKLIRIAELQELSTSDIQILKNECLEERNELRAKHHMRKKEGLEPDKKLNIKMTKTDQFFKAVHAIWKSRIQNQSLTKEICRQHGLIA